LTTMSSTNAIIIKMASSTGNTRCNLSLPKKDFYCIYSKSVLY
jgi:hypothetical protein